MGWDGMGWAGRGVSGVSGRSRWHGEWGMDGCMVYSSRRRVLGITGTGSNSGSQHHHYHLHHQPHHYHHHHTIITITTMQSRRPPHSFPIPRSVCSGREAVDVEPVIAALPGLEQ